MREKAQRNPLGTKPRGAIRAYLASRPGTVCDFRCEADDKRAQIGHAKKAVAISNRTALNG